MAARRQAGSLSYVLPHHQYALEDALDDDRRANLQQTSGVRFRVVDDAFNLDTAHRPQRCGDNSSFPNQFVAFTTIRCFVAVGVGRVEQKFVAVRKPQHELLACVNRQQKRQHNRQPFGAVVGRSLKTGKADGDQ